MEHKKSTNKSRNNNMKSNNKKIDNEHDKVVKELLKEEDEEVYILNKALRLSLKSDEIEIYTNSFVTSNYKYKDVNVNIKMYIFLKIILYKIVHFYFQFFSKFVESFTLILFFSLYDFPFIFITCE